MIAFDYLYIHFFLSYYYDFIENYILEILIKGVQMKNLLQIKKKSRMSLGFDKRLFPLHVKESRPTETELRAKTITSSQ